jgi:high-affinity iron transporter
MLARAIFMLLLTVSFSARADSTARTIVHLLDYVSVDYPEFVKDGRVLDDTEYKEQLEFSGRVVELLGQLPDVPQRRELIGHAEQLKGRIAAKAAGAEVSRIASRLRWQVIDAYKVAVAPVAAPDLKRGGALYAEQCAGCHGAQGRGDGLAAKGLDPSPANFHDRVRMGQRSVYGLYSTITLGVAGTSMNSYGHLPDDERWALAFYVATLGSDAHAADNGRSSWDQGRGRKEVGNLRALATLTDNEVAEKYGNAIAGVFAWLKANPHALADVQESPIAYSRRLLGESVAAYRTGKQREAQSLALAAYLEGFELAEASLDAVDRNLRQEVEARMIAYRDLLRRTARIDDVSQLATHIDHLLQASADKLGGEALSPTTAAVSALFILLREGVEALLVVAAIVAFLTKAGRREAVPWIHAGWVGALVLGLITWFVAAKLIGMSGATRELTEGVTALLAAAILLYVGYWLHGKAYANAWKQFIETRLKGALERGTLWALAGLSFLAVYREAFETVLFYQALWQQAGDAARGSVLVGFFSAIAGLVAIAWAILRYGVRLPIGAFFGACSVLMALLAVIFTGQGIKALQEAGFVTASPLHAITVAALGIYPTEETTVAQIVVLLVVAAVFAWAHARGRRRPTAI